MTELLELHALTVRESVEIARRITPGDLGKPTPCSAWTVKELLTHMTTQHIGFAAALEGHGAELSFWQPAPDADYGAAAEHVISAFNRPGALERDVVLPEIPVAPTFTGKQALRFHYVDYVVHGWDLARALDRPFDLPVAAFEAAIPIAERVPDGDNRKRPGASFAPSLPVAQDTSPLDRVLLLLGRNPNWPA